MTIFMTYGCKKSNQKSEAVDSTKLYKGVLITKSCPSYAYVKINNSNIGENWTYNSTVYSNVIGISNCPDSIKIGSSVSFYISNSKNYLNCLIQTPCLEDITIDQKPANIYCSKNLKNQ